MKKTTYGRLVHPMIAFGIYDAELEVAIQLLPTQWDAVKYDKTLNIINFPGEYDIQGISLTARSDQDGTMHYAYTTNGKKTIILQNTAGLDSEHASRADKRYLTDPSLAEVLSRRELEGAVETLE